MRDGAAPLWVRSITWITGAEAGAGRVARVEDVEDQPRGGVSSPELSEVLNKLASPPAV